MIGRFPWDPFPPGEPDPKGPDPLHGVAYRAAVRAADAYRSVRLALRREDGALRVGNRFVPDGRYREVGFVSVGRAAGSMAFGALHALGDRLTQGFIAGPEDPPDELPFQHVIVPDGLPGATPAEAVVRAATEIVEGLGPQDLFLVLLSPGALRALAVPPPGMSPEDLTGLFRSLASAGVAGGPLGRIARVVSSGAVGGRLAAACANVDTATLVVDRGDGPGVVGGGPMDPVRPDERAEVRDWLQRAAVLSQLPPATRDSLAPGTLGPSVPPTVSRPVVVAQPSDALRASADAVFDKGWTSRLAFLEIRDPPASAADAFLSRAEEIVRDENLTPVSRTKGVAVFAMATLGLAEGVDEGPAAEAFIAAATPRLRRREMSVGIYRTAGAIGTTRYPAGTVFGPPTDTTVAVPPDRARTIPMRPGITDVGLIAVALCAVPAGAGPARAGGVRR